MLKNIYFKLKNQINIGHNNTISNKSNSRIKKSILLGNNNIVTIEGNCVFEILKIVIKGNNNTILISSNVNIQQCELWVEDNHCSIFIGENTTIQDAHLAATEDYSRIEIGSDCMLATNIEIRTGDSHSVVDTVTQQRLNPAASVRIGDHVWLASRVTVLKGVTIGNDSIVATGAVVTKSMPAFSLIAGVPAQVIKQQVSWQRERI